MNVRPAMAADSGAMAAPMNEIIACIRYDSVPGLTYFARPGFSGIADGRVFP